MAALRSLLRNPNLKQASRLLLPNRGAGFEKVLTQAPKTEVTQLSNGFRVASEKTPHQTATIGVYIDAGSRFENDANNGTAHFLEHMAFKGTNSRSQSDIELEVENIGAHLNAYTSREQTVYYAKCLVKDVPRIVDLLADILQNSKLAEPQVEMERNVIIREMQEVNNQPEEVVFDHLHAIAFQGTPLGRTILGPEKNIRSITRQDLQSYIKTHYTAPRIVLAAAGGVDHGELVKLSEKAFGSLPSGPTVQDKAPRCPFTGSEVRVRDDYVKQAHVALAVEGVGWSHEDFFPLMVANSVIGSWDRSFGGSQNLVSPLAQEVASNGLANKYMSFNSAYTDTGLWGVYAVCEPEKLEDFVWELQAEWMRLCQSASDVEVERARNQLKASLFFQLDGTFPTCDEIGRQVLTYGRRIPTAEINARINAITAGDVRRVATKYIFDKDPAVVGYGAIEQLPDYNRVRSSMFWLRT